MKKIVTLLCFLSSFIFAHMCHDPFRPIERLIVFPEKDIKIEKSGEFRVYIENTFQTTLRNLQLIVENPAFEISVKPEFLEKVLPGERTFFLVKLQLKEGYPQQEYSLQVSVAAESAEISPSVEKINITAIEEAEEKKPVPKVAKEGEVVPQTEVKEGFIPEVEKKPEITKITPLVREEDRGIIVKVEKIPFWKKPYFSALLALLLIFFLMLRKLRSR